MNGSEITVVHVGSACRDIAPEDARGWRIGGGVMYAALTTARLGLRTAAVVGVDKEAAGAAELDMLRDAGVDILRVPLPEGPIYHNVETPTGRVQTCVQPGVPLPIPALPAAWLAAPGWSVVPVAGEIDDTWAEVVPAGAHVAVAWQGLLRDLRAGERVRHRPPRPSPILERADLIGVSRHDVAPDIPLRALWSLLRPGADLLITQGDQGGLLLRLGTDGPDAILRYRSPASDAETDPTGAGDTYLAALHASGLRAAAATGTERRDTIRDSLDLRFAAAAGSLVVEDWGLAGVPGLAAVEARLDRDHDPDAVAAIPAEDARAFWPEGATIE
jgi:sugar/nucleoside kinase (ribokinase family)